MFTNLLEWALTNSVRDARVTNPTGSETVVTWKLWFTLPVLVTLTRIVADFPRINISAMINHTKSIHWKIDFHTLFLLQICWKYVLNMCMNYAWLWRVKRFFTRKSWDTCLKSCDAFSISWHVYSKTCAYKNLVMFIKCLVMLVQYLHLISFDVYSIYWDACDVYSLSCEAYLNIAMPVLHLLTYILYHVMWFFFNDFVIHIRKLLMHILHVVMHIRNHYDANPLNLDVCVI